MSSRPSPYPGPRSFQRGERLYGRDQELAALLDLLIAERVILLYSPSGAGKTSLLNAGLIPALEGEGFRVLPPMRVNAALPGNASAPAGRYTLSCLLSLEEGLPQQEQLPLAELAGLSLDRYLARRAGPTGTNDSPWHGDVLIFDQFEEVLTRDPTDREGKLAFFEQVGEALRDRSRWALFAMREEFIAGLDPYLKPIPTRFDKSRRFRLELLSPAAAIQAMQEPARQAGVDFSDAAAARLAADLAAVRVQQPDGSTRITPGDAVEPVQLQVVCWRLWERLAADDNTIDQADIEAIGDVDAALRGYYAATAAAVAASTGVSERILRDWIENTLITAQDIRGQVLQGVDASDGLPNAAIWQLVDAHLLRAEQRRGATWFELAHDRLVRPVREENATWREATLSPLQRSALRWQQQGKPANSPLLLTGRDLAQAEKWARGHAADLSALDREFLGASQEAQRGQRLRRRLAGIAALAAIFLTLAAAVSAKLLLDANAVRRQDRARTVAAQARNVQFTQPDLSLLLSAEAMQLTSRPSNEINAALLAVLDDNPQLEQVLHTGQQSIRALAISPDQRLLATGAADGQVRLWERRTAAELAISPLPSDGSGVSDLAMAPDRALLAVADKRGRVTLWDLSGEQEVRSGAGDLPGAFRDATAWPQPSPTPPPPLPPHQTTQVSAGQVNAIDFSPDGRRAATVGRDEALLWRVEGLTLVDPQPLERSQPTRSVAFSPDGDSVAVGRDDGSIALHSLASGLSQTLIGEQGMVQALDFSPDGNWLAAGINTPGLDEQIGVVQIWNLVTASALAQTPEQRQASPDQTLRDFSRAVESVAFSDDGQVLASAGRDGVIQLWNVADGVPFGQPLRGHPAWINDLAFEPGGQSLYSAGSKGEINHWLLARRTRIGQPLPGDDGQVWSVAFSPDSAWLASGSRAGAVRLWQVADQTAQELERRSDGVTAVAFSPDGAWLAAGGLDGAVHLLDGRSGAPLAQLPGNNWITALAFSPDNARLATANADNQVLLWELSAGPAVSATLTASLASRITALAFDPQGKMLYGGDAAGTVFQWDAARRQMRSRLNRLNVDNVPVEIPVASLAIDPSGKLLAFASHDNAIYLRRLPDLQSAGGGVLAGHTRPASAVVFHPNGEMLASAGHDGAIILWDIDTQQQIGSPLRGHDGPINGLAFSADGRWLASAGDDQQVILWPMTPEKWVDIACRIVGRPLSEAEIGQYLSGEPARACQGINPSGD
ncbi:MAG TPA: WD40 repeat domain-containing protein [Anaerolineae bacterium]|nr:WD40 repeat domain-containing protein [Anaerolineae bacterium]HNU03051.1 WD40 repeat domain-containing protein [Anaerolineae bacterium]HNU03414.1 WD40 repeat domain-containing protein [Anaerolineae bacterium]